MDFAIWLVIIVWLPLIYMKLNRIVNVLEEINRRR